MLELPRAKPRPVVQKGEFRFAAIGLEHGHIYGMCGGLIEAGGELVWVYDPDPAKVDELRKARYPDARRAVAIEQVLEDPTVHLVASAAIPSERCTLGLRVMEHGKDFFADKPPLTTLEQLATARKKVEETGRKYAVYYSERLHVESAVFAGELIQAGAIGRVLQVINLAPHRLAISRRPDWFFSREKYGGILCDLGSHQIDQFLFYAGADDAQVLHSKVGNYAHKEYPGLDDFGDATLLAEDGATGYLRVDWFTPDGLRTWGDGRTFVLGTEGYLELRKYIDVGRDPSGDHVLLVNGEGEQHLSVHGKVGFPYFGQLILDCLNRTEAAMTQAHAFKVIELAIRAQTQAVRVE